MTPHATTFHFEGYRFFPKKKEFHFTYRIDFSDRAPLTFTETIRLPRSPQKISTAFQKKFLEPLHLILGISYYKLYCPPKIALPFLLSKEQATFWTTVYKKGLGEFLYRNKIDPKRLATFPSSSVRTAPIRLDVEDRALLGIGGGKDSIVAGELLRDVLETTSFLVETQRRDPIADRVAKEMGYPALRIQRMLDPQIFLPHEGAYNGHIPISAVFAFLGLLTSALYGYRYVVVGNEHSSNVGNLRYRGETINHQWSKSAEFEAMLQEYTRKFITPDITYVSLLRPFFEIRIAKMFAKHKQYFSLFSSCNRNFTVSRERPKTLWCGTCPKCAFVFLILSPFVPRKDLCSIFGKNLFADPSLVPLYKEILGFGTQKPFDCVGTFEEARAALFLASKKDKRDIVVRTFLPKIKHGRHLVETVMSLNRAPTLPTRFRLLGLNSVCLLGYGREGKVTHAYLKKTYPHLSIGILDKSRDKNYLAKQSRYELAVKTPGIPKTVVTIPYITATNLFFSRIQNPVIGVTGSKGKSTTASLIYAMLKCAEKKVRLVGNVGEPMLGVLVGRIDPEEIFVVELSSYMLDDIEYSPDVAVLTNLFPEHMNYHGGVANYYRAKKNIFAFQRPGDVAIRPPFHARIPVKEKEIPLLGPHNRTNIQAAIEAVRSFGVSVSAIRKAIKSFKPLPHRLEFVATVQGFHFYDDAISTTPESTIMALRSLSPVGTIFLGGEDRGYDFRSLEKALRKYHVRNVVLFPESGKRILRSRRGFTVLETRRMEEAVGFAMTHTRPGEICLLSTASPSYSLWKNFEEKGEEFQRLIKKQLVGK